MLIFRLFWEFFKTGLFAIGGGLATLPFLYDMQAATGWFTLDDISNMIAISESTPGPMGINMATYTGFTSMGVLGGIAAVAGLVTPSIIIIIIVSNILEKFKTNKYVQYCMYGLRAGYPHALGLRLKQREEISGPLHAALSLQQGKNPMELFGEFHFYVSGVRMEEEDRRLLKQAIRQAGVKDE